MLYSTIKAILYFRGVSIACLFIYFLLFDDVFYEVTKKNKTATSGSKKKKKKK